MIVTICHCSCVDQHEAVIGDLRYKLNKTGEELVTANKCENNLVFVIFTVNKTLMQCCL